jgi:hypothetical protein
MGKEFLDKSTSMCMYEMSTCSSIFLSSFNKADNIN